MVTPTPDNLAAALQHFGLQRDRLRASFAGAVGLSATELDALEHLEAAGPLTQRELGDRLVLTSGAITMLVDRLEERGVVARRAHPTDRRATLVEITESAGADLPAALVAYHGQVRRLARALTGAQRLAVLEFLGGCADAALHAAKEMGQRD